MMTYTTGVQTNPEVGTVLADTGPRTEGSAYKVLLMVNSSVDASVSLLRMAAPVAVNPESPQAKPAPKAEPAPKAPPGGGNVPDTIIEEQVFDVLANTIIQISQMTGLLLPGESIRVVLTGAAVRKPGRGLGLAQPLPLTLPLPLEGEAKVPQVSGRIKATLQTMVVAASREVS